MSYQTIIFEVTDGVARLTFNRPDRLNSFNTEMHAEVRAALATLPGDARVLVITGAGRGFCAGQDLNDRAVAPGAAPPDLAESIEKNYKPLVLALRALPLPVIAAVNGVAAGAGANIALACDLVIAAAPQASCRRSRGSGSCPTQAARGSCRAWRAPRVPWALRCSGTSCRRSRPPTGG